jgi:hypothetical protein
VLAEYLERNPAALADHLVARYDRNGSTAEMLRGVLVGDRQHELGTAIFAIITALVFGIGFGRSFSSCTAPGVSRWERVGDQARHAVVLLSLFGLIALLLVQTTEIAEHPAGEPRGSPWMGHRALRVLRLGARYPHTNAHRRAPSDRVWAAN